MADGAPLCLVGGLRDACRPGAGVGEGPVSRRLPTMRLLRVAFIAAVVAAMCSIAGFSGAFVLVLPASARLQNEPGNVFVADTNHGAAPSSRGGGPEVAVHWRSDAALQIAHHPNARVFLAEHRIGDVQVDYGR
jgi:hypothetical protein